MPHRSLLTKHVLHRSGRKNAHAKHISNIIKCQQGRLAPCRTCFAQPLCRDGGSNAPPFPPGPMVAGVNKIKMDRWVLFLLPLARSAINASGIISYWWYLYFEWMYSPRRQIYQIHSPVSRFIARIANINYVQTGSSAKSHDVCKM